MDVLDEAGSSQKNSAHEVFKHKISSDGFKQGPLMKHEVGGTLQTEKEIYDLHRDHYGSCDLASSERIDCGYNGINQHQCEAKGCCWRPGEEGQAWCFFKGMKFEDEFLPGGCGNCFGAGSDGECCNTCDELKAAYMKKGWRLKLNTAPQCQREAFRETMIDQYAEDGGCQLYGQLDLSQSSGHFHIAPHKGIHKDSFNLAAGFFNLLELISFTFDQFNITHTINSLTFGDQFPGISSPLDGQTRRLEDTHGMYQYYVKIVPTRYRYSNGREVESNQYSVTEHLRHLSPGSGRGLPGVYFYYELSPLHAVFEEKRRGFLPFLTSVCAIVGGAYTIMGVVDTLVSRITSLLPGAAELLR